MLRRLGVLAAGCLSGCMGLVAALSLAMRARAQDCRGRDAPVVALSAGPGVGALVPVAAVVRQLDAGVASSGLRACLDAETTTWLARVRLDADAFQAQTLRIHVDDRVTGKVLERPVALAGIPQDSRAVAVALYAEELVQASWAELALTGRARRAQRAPPPQVARELGSVLRVPSPVAANARLQLALGAAGWVATKGVSNAGPLVWVSLGLWRRLAIALRVGYRVAPRVAAADGSIRLQLLHFGAFVEPQWPLGARVDVLVPQGIDLAQVRFTAEADPGAHARDALRYALWVSHGLGLRYRFDAPLTVAMSARLCWTLRSARATDGEHVAAALDGIGAELELRLGTYF